MAPFIVLEGIDGSGKGTQAKMLKERFAEIGMDPFLTEEPTKGPIGKLIREHMSDPFLDDKSLALLFAADRIEHLEKQVRPALESGKVVISDRYVYSTIAYQGQSIDMDWIGQVNDYADRPDLVILLDLPPSLGRRRLEDRDTDWEYFEESQDFQEGVRKAFISLSKGHHLPDSLKADFFVVDASLRKVEVFDQIWDRVEMLL